MTPKPWYQSKTVYFNALTGLVFLATYFFGYQPNDVVTHNVQSVVTDPLFIMAGNILLRLVTKQAVSLVPVQQPAVQPIDEI